MRPYLTVQLAVAGCALCAGLAACGSSSPTSTGTTSPATTPPSTATSTPSATPASSPSTTALSTPTQKKIAANWTDFFNPKESIATRVGLLQDGPALEATITTMSKSATASQTAAKVVDVTVLSSTQAKVTYDILLAGKPVLTNQSGTAVLEGGTWKVGTASFCAIASLSGTKPMPAACAAG
jgi:hypothetical protein